MSSEIATDSKLIMQKEYNSWSKARPSSREISEKSSITTHFEFESK